MCPRVHDYIEHECLGRLKDRLLKAEARGAETARVLEALRERQDREEAGVNRLNSLLKSQNEKLLEENELLSMRVADLDSRLVAANNYILSIENQH